MYACMHVFPQTYRVERINLALKERLLGDNSHIPGQISHPFFCVSDCTLYMCSIYTVSVQTRLVLYTYETCVCIRRVPMTVDGRITSPGVIVVPRLVG